jgi:hypothetical protein
MPDAVRYSLDSLFVSDAADASGHLVTSLATYFSTRHELKEFAIHFIEAVRDDRRLQTDNRIRSWLAVLARIRGACAAVANVISAKRVPGPECPLALQGQIQHFVRDVTPAGRDSQSRRQALFILKSQDVNRSAEK